MRMYKKWRMNYSNHLESDRGIESISTTITHVILVIIVLGTVYTFFAKTEEGSIAHPSAIKTNAVEFSEGDAEEGHIDEDGLRALIKPQQRRT